MKNIENLVEAFANGDLIVQFTNKDHLAPFIDYVFDDIDGLINDTYDYVDVDVEWDDNADIKAKLIANAENEWDKYGASTAYRIKDNKLVFKNIEKHIKKDRAFITSNEFLTLIQPKKENAVKNTAIKLVDSLIDTLGTLKNAIAELLK